MMIIAYFYFLCSNNTYFINHALKIKYTIQYDKGQRQISYFHKQGQQRLY